MLGALKVLQSLVERILEPLDSLDVLYVHGVWREEGGEEGRIKKKITHVLNHTKLQKNTYNKIKNYTLLFLDVLYTSTPVCSCTHKVS